MKCGRSKRHVVWHKVNVLPPDVCYLYYLRITNDVLRYFCCARIYHARLAVKAR